MDLCKYKNALGEPRKGFHETRIPVIDLALYDVLGTGVLIAILHYTLNISLIWLIVIVLLLTILTHKLFCVDTKLNTSLGL